MNAKRHDTPNAGGRYVRVGGELYEQGKEPKKAAKKKTARKPARKAARKSKEG